MGKAARSAKGARKQSPPEGPADEALDPRAKSALRENFESIIVAVLFAVFVRAFIAQPYKIPSGSMEDTLLIGDHLVVDKLAFGDGASQERWSLLPTRKVHRGDVVIFRPPPVPGVTDESTDFIKRVIGLPGEKVTLTYEPERNGVTVAIDGRRLPENHRIGHFTEPVKEAGAQWTVTMAGDPPELRYPGWLVRSFQLGPDEYFMMGDNRNDSADSRFWRHSYAVRGERIRGLARFVYWSYEVPPDGDPEPVGLAAQLQRYGSILVHFFSRSRWERTFQRIR